MKIFFSFLSIILATNLFAENQFTLDVTKRGAEIPSTLYGFFFEDINFAGEYSCRGEGKNWNNFEASLLEATFMTNIERNADIVEMATYAPLFAHIEGWQWHPDLIWFDNTRCLKTYSYYV